MIKITRFFKYFDYYMETFAKRLSGRSHMNPYKNGEYAVLNNLLKKKKNKKFCFFDGGSNIGNHLIYFNKICKEQGIADSIIYAAEPFPASLKSLKLSIYLNKVNCKIFPVALGSAEKKINFYYMKKNISSGANSSFPHLYLKNRMKVEQITLDKIIIENKIEKIDFLKLDIEGMEYEALLGAKNSLSNNIISYIQLEYNQTWIEGGASIKKILGICEEFNFKLFRINRASLVSIPRYDFNLEDFCYSNLLLVKNGKPLPLPCYKKALPYL
jgi:FkbM family methyltransferase